MSIVTLIHAGQRREVSSVHIEGQCNLFDGRPSLLRTPYVVTSTVPREVFQQFVSALEGHPIDITDANVCGLSALSREFGFEFLASKVMEFEDGQRVGDSTQNDSTKFPNRLSALEKGALQRDRDISELRSQLLIQSQTQEMVLERLLRIETDLAKLNSEFTTLRSSDVVTLRADVSNLKWTQTRIPAVLEQTVIDAPSVSSTVESNSNCNSAGTVLRVLRQSRLIAERDRFLQSSHIRNDYLSYHFRATDATTGKEVCLTIVGEDPSCVRDQKEVLRKVEVLAGNHHCATQKLIAFCLDPNSDVPSAIVTEFHPNGDLHTALEKEWRGGNALDATVKSKIIFGIVAAMAHLHSRGILHRDLRPSKILLNDRWEPVLGGFTVFYPSDGEFRIGMEAAMCRAPELYNESPDGWGFSVDVYAFAIILYSIFAKPKVLNDGRRPPSNAGQIEMRMSRGARFLKTPEIPKYHWGVINRCWNQGPGSRPTSKILLDEFHESHEYILPGANRWDVLRYEELVYSQ
jgi:hypothetical protein